MSPVKHSAEAPAHPELPSDLSEPPPGPPMIPSGHPNGSQEQFGSCTEADKDDEICIICMNPITVSEEVCSSTSCAHFVHKEGLLRWLRQTRTCPHCRTRVDGVRTRRGERVPLPEVEAPQPDPFPDLQDYDDDGDDDDDDDFMRGWADEEIFEHDRLLVLMLAASEAPQGRGEEGEPARNSRRTVATQTEEQQPLMPDATTAAASRNGAVPRADTRAGALREAQEENARRLARRNSVIPRFSIAALLSLSCGAATPDGVTRAQVLRQWQEDARRLGSVEFGERMRQEEERAGEHMRQQEEATEDEDEEEEYDSEDGIEDEEEEAEYGSEEKEEEEEEQTIVRRPGNRKIVLDDMKGMKAPCEGSLDDEDDDEINFPIASTLKRRLQDFVPRDDPDRKRRRSSQEPSTSTSSASQE